MGSFSIAVSSQQPPGSGLFEVQVVLDSAAKFGTATSENGAQMYGHVPHVAPEAWFHILYPQLQEKDLVELENRLRRPIPDPYRQFLKITNGLTLFSGALDLEGLRRDYSRRVAIREPFDLGDPNIRERPRAAEPRWFIFAFYQADGSRAYVDPDGGHVYRSNRDMTKPRLNHWPSFDEFLAREVRRLTTHFDRRGRRLDPSRSTAPEPAS